MNELIGYLATHGFLQTDIITDGKVHRFDKDGKKNAWYIASEFFTGNGEPYFICTFGDWKTGEKYNYRPAKKLPKSEITKINKQIDDNLKKADFEEQNLHEEVSQFVEKEIKYCSSKLMPEYLIRKKIDKLYGAKSNIENDGRALYVPCKDITGKLWGIQKIHKNGDKYFSAGQRVKGTFHLMPENCDLTRENLIYICEGFATAASVHMATKLPTIAAFNAGNLPEVAKSIKKTYNHLSIVICGDDDKKTEGNPGRVKAEEAAKAVMGKAIFPKFVNDSTNPTDFNDLHCLEDLKAVSDQLSQVEPEKSYIICLGHKDGKFYYTSSRNKEITIISSGSHNQHTLIDLMPIEYWANLFPTPKGCDWHLAENHIKQGCITKGIFDPSIIRGPGVWRDNGQIIINTGKSLFIDGKEQTASLYKSKFFYTIGKKFPRPIDKKLNIAERTELLDMFLLLPWKSPEYGKLLAGWCLLAPFCGALAWRPHIWVSGPAGTGKSYILSDIVGKMIEPFMVAFQGSTTEAGIRQTIQSEAKPITFDEFETDDKKSSDRVQSILELFRQASSDSMGNMYKGTATQSALKYQTRFMACVGSIRVNLQKEADISRFTQLELVKKSNPEQFKSIKSIVAKLTDEHILSFYSQNFQNLPTILHNISTLQTVISKEIDARTGQQYSALIAGYLAYINYNKIDENDAMKLLDQFNLKSSINEKNDTDHDRCFYHLKVKIITIDTNTGRQDVSISEMIRSNNPTYEKPLARIGIKVDSQFIYVSNKHPELVRIFAATPWENNYKDSLRRINGADNNGNIAMRINGETVKVTRIPLKTLENDSDT